MRPLKYLYYKRKSEIAITAKIYPLTIITNSSIGDYSYISYLCKINNTIIGKFCSIAQNVKMGLGKHPINFISTSPIFYSLKNPLKYKLNEDNLYSEHDSIIIGNDVWIGTNVTILDGVKIGDGAVIGAHSLVTKDIAPYSIVGGVPAKEIKKRFSPEIITKLLEIKWWNYSEEILKNVSIIKIFSKEINLKIVKELEEQLNKK